MEEKTVAKFAQIHTLRSYPAALLNRDNTGYAKSLVYGGEPRTRISSQSVKRSWRLYDGKYAPSRIEGVEDSVRSRNVVTGRVMEGVEGDDSVLKAVDAAFNVGVYGEKGESLESRQTLLLGSREVEFLRSRAQEIADGAGSDAEKAKEEAKLLFADRPKNGERKNMKAFRAQTLMPGGLSAALFGRMDTSDPDANIQASVHVSHSFTVHKVESVTDFFTAVDDLPAKASRTSHIGSSELNSGLYYGYAVIDVPTLVSNVEGVPYADWESADRKLAAKIAGRMLWLASTVSPSAKLGPTAPYSWADFMLVEVGDAQPRSLASAFRSPVSGSLDDAAGALSEYVGSMDAIYGVEFERRFFSSGSGEVPGAKRSSIREMEEWLEKAIERGEAVLRDG